MSPGEIGGEQCKSERNRDPAGTWQDDHRRAREKQGKSRHDSCDALYLVNHRLFRRLFRIPGSLANRVPRIAAIGLVVALLWPACASNRGMEGVGPPIVISPVVATQPKASDELADTGLIVVTWNVHEGRGDIAALLESLGSAQPPLAAHVILLLQEVTRHTIPAAAEPLGLFTAYVPSMPNGRKRTGDDRGCAILSTLPISDVSFQELPWVYQRRVAVMGRIDARMDGQPFTLRVVSAHLDNRPGRKRQAESLARWLQPYAADAAVVVGADLNTWFGVGEDTVRAMDAVVPRAIECGDRPTFRFGRRLDYLFTTLSAPVRKGCDVLRDRFGSDHHPIVLRLLR